MANHDNLSSEGPVGKGESAGNDSIARLMRLAGPRPAVPENVRDRIHQAVKSEWRSALKQRRTRRWGIPLAFAAAVVLAVALIPRGPEVTVAPVATVAVVAGNAAPGSRGLSVGDRIYRGDLVATGKHGVALALDNGFSLRVAEGSTVSFDTVNELTLLSGRLYADTGRSIYDDRSITVNTAIGSATDQGTQFAVAFFDGNMRVSVREGSVDVTNRHDSYTAAAGDVLTLDGNSTVEIERIAVYGSDWDWASDLAPTFDIENRTLLEFLQWAARETGRELVFENESVRMAAMGTRLHAPVSDLTLTPGEALDSVLPTTNFQYDVDERRIVIGDPSQ